MTTWWRKEYNLWTSIRAGGWQLHASFWGALASQWKRYLKMSASSEPSGSYLANSLPIPSLEFWRLVKWMLNSCWVFNAHPPPRPLSHHNAIPLVVKSMLVLRHMSRAWGSESIYYVVHHGTKGNVQQPCTAFPPQKYFSCSLCPFFIHQFKQNLAKCCCSHNYSTF